MVMTSIKIVHVSDLHISEHLLRAPDKKWYLPHRYGHDVSALLALDSFLKETEWDLLLITGDVSRIGNIESFEGVRNWLENEMHFGDTRIGLNLSKRADRQYLVIPGNHDRFNGALTQGSLDCYHQEFPVVRSGTSATRMVGSQVVTIHVYDSTCSHGGFAFGKIDQKYLIPKHLSSSDVNVALLHHHFLQPPKHPREIATELTNSAEVAAYMLNTGFDLICFEHTHKGYIGQSSVNILSGLLNDKRKRRQFWSRILPKFVLRRTEEDCLVSYRREAAQDGRLPTLAAYFDYLYLRQQGHELKGPSQFDSIRLFYKQMKEVIADTRIADELSKTKEQKVLISLAPSACQAEARWKGFYTIALSKDGGRLSADWDRYEFDGVKFERLPRDAHVS
jgi:predicted phosphodiesterase